MTKKIIIVMMVLIMCLGILSSCVDYGYVFHFSVEGGNGTIVYRWWDSAKSMWREKASPVVVRGGKKASKKRPYKLELTAFPDDGYQVKEWKFNGEVVESNKSNSFTAIVENSKQAKNNVTVEFEPIPSEN